MCDGVIRIEGRMNTPSHSQFLRGKEHEPIYFLLEARVGVTECVPIWRLQASQGP